MGIVGVVPSQWVWVGQASFMDERKCRLPVVGKESCDPWTEWVGRVKTPRAQRGALRRVALYSPRFVLFTSFVLLLLRAGSVPGSDLAF